MFTDFILLIFAVIVILLCAELFTNGIEWFGHILKLSERIVGSVLAAIGTSLPEAAIPFVAVIGFGKSHGNEVSIGAITGAPFMLVTLAFAVCGTTIWVRSFRKPSHRLRLDSSVIIRNLQFFLLAYSIGLISTFFTRPGPVRWLIALCLVLIYFLYVSRLLAQPSSSSSTSPDSLHISKLLARESNHITLILLQLFIGIIGIICGAYIFVDHLQAIATFFNVSPLFVSLIITPIATELPEQATSFAWARRGKDTLALGIISGSMVFQSCFPVAFGVACTPWKLDIQVLTTAFVSLALAVTYMIMAKKKILTPLHLMSSFLIYIVTLAGICAGALHH